MKQVLQNLRNGETLVVDVPIPSPQPGEVLVRTAASLVSAGTERMVVSFAEKSLLGKARARPDLVRQVLEKGQREGWLTTLEAVLGRLDQPLALGYSSAGVVVGLGEGVQKVRPRSTGGLRRWGLRGARRVRLRARESHRPPAAGGGF